jgi:hypothetical protein
MEGLRGFTGVRKHQKKLKLFLKGRSNSKSSEKGKCGGRRDGWEMKEGMKIKEM